MIVSLVIYLSLAFAFWYAGPISNHRSFVVLFQSAPDQLLLPGINVVLALIGAMLQAARLVGLRKSIVS
jgi:hypothetical protein